ncbi:MAG: NAD(P)-dependent oxidoreductase, partial [Gluconacetobacter sp.]
FDMPREGGVLATLWRGGAPGLGGAGVGGAGGARALHDVPGVACHAGEEGFLPFLAGLDSLVCLLPATPETRGILGARTFAALPRGACVINAGRGSHLVEADLIAALDAGQIEGAVLDVFAPEPLPPQNPLWHHPKVILPPHGAPEAARPAKAAHAVQVIRAVLRGEEAPLRYRSERGY